MVNETKKISIITPTYNRDWSIKRAINSVKNQTNDNWELIIIDDGSTDNTKELLKPYLNDNRIKYYYQSNKGVNFARNFGITKATSKYITFLDSDDEILPKAIDQMITDSQILDNKDISLLIYQAKDSSNNKIIDEIKEDIKLNFKEIIKGKWPKGEAIILLKKEIFSRLRFPVISYGSLPGFFWYRIVKYYGHALRKKECLRVYYTEHSDRITGGKQTLKRAKGMAKLYDLFLKEFSKDYIKYNPKKLSYFYLEKGFFEIINKEFKKGRESLKEAINYNNKKIPLVIMIYLLSYLPNKLFIKLVIILHRFKRKLK
jgi:glycosyltransferase involved in cell wall biosynthesis